MQEIWKDIQGYKGLYQVSNLGRVKSLRRVLPDGRIWKEKITKTNCRKNSYPSVGLSTYKNHTTFRIHVLVAKAFLPIINGKNEVNHIDGNKHNNKVSNLEWCTRSENNKHAYNIGLRLGQKIWLGKKGKNHISSKVVLNTETGIYYESLKEAAIFCNYKYSTLSARLSGRKENKTSLTYV